MLSFLGIGAQKAGTSWLFQQLRQHPQVAFPGGKEIHFWDQKKHKGLSWYREIFQRPDEGSNGLPIRRGEITPAYAGLPEAVIAEMARHFPDLKLLYLLRNPIDRAWSSAEMARMRSELRSDEVSDQWYQDHFLSDGSRQRGDYLLNLQAWQQHFPKDQLLLLDYENIKRNPRQLLRRVARHLDIDPQAVDQLPQASLTQRVFKGSGKPLRPSLAPLLIELYRSDIQALAQHKDSAFAEGWRLPDVPPLPVATDPAGKATPSQATAEAVADSSFARHSDNRHRRRCGIMIMGMHRSGTSVCARLCHLLGADLGGEPDGAPDKALMSADRFNPRGYWENLQLSKFHEGLMIAEGSSWAEPEKLPNNWLDSPASSPVRKAILSNLNRSFFSSDLWAVKDPRLSHLAPLYQRFQPFLRTDLVSLIVLRHPLAVAASLKERNGFSVNRALRLWLDYNVAAEALSRTGPRAFVLYEDMLTDWKAAFHAVGQQLELDWPQPFQTAEGDAASFLSADLNHHQAASEDGSSTEAIDPVLYDQALQMFDLLQTLTADPWNQVTREQIASLKSAPNSKG
ncbi:sulfotransferase [Rhodovibrionaceae bacterium A322]